MRQNLKLPRRPRNMRQSIQAAFVRVGDPERDDFEAISVQVHPTRDGLVELDVGDQTEERRVVMGPGEARVLASIFERMHDAANGPKLAGTLRQAADLAEQATSGAKA